MCGMFFYSQKFLLVVAFVAAVSADVSHLLDNSNGYNYQQPQPTFDDTQSISPIEQQKPTTNYLPPVQSEWIVLKVLKNSNSTEKNKTY